MPNTREIVRALVSAFNVHNYARDTVKTNFTLQSRGGKDCIVVSFDKGMNDYQCSEYLYNIKRKIIGEFYGIEEGDTDEVVLNTAKLIFDVKSFPFNDYKGDWSVDKQGRIEFLAPIDQGVIFNLKSHLASSLKKDILEDMPVSGTTVPFNKGKYLCCSKFPDKESRQQFEREFLSRMRGRYENVPKNPLKIEGNSVYIRDVFDDARFIDSVTRRVAWLVGRDLQADSKSRSDVRAFKDLIMEILDPSTRVVTSAFLCASPLNREETSILIPVILSNRGTRFLTKEEARDINHKFNNPVLDDISDKTQATFKVNGSSGIYGIDFSNKEISHCVITKIIESSVINKDHELAIDPELHLQALSPAQSPFNSPTHAEPPRTPPEQTGARFFSQEDRDSGIGESPPKPKDSDSAGPSSRVQKVSLMQSHGKKLERLPRQFSEQKQELYNHIDLAGTSIGPSTQMSYPTVSCGVPGLSSPSQSLGAAESGSAVTSTRGSYSSPPPSVPSPGARFRSWVDPFVIGLSSRANVYLRNPCLPQGTSGNKCSQSSSFVSRPSSSKGANEWRTSDKPLTEEEKNLFKELLYAFNLNNYILEYPNTNFIVKNGKIVSLINDDVDVKEYLKEVRGETIKEYCVNEKEAYDLNEFPFKFLSNCEKNQETTVVANISCGALFNLKKLFIQGHEKEVEIEDIDINIVEKAVKSKKDEWVDSQVKECRVRPCEAITTCYPDESELEHILIIKDKGGYCLDRTYRTWEVKSFVERWHAKGTSVAGKGSSKAEEKTSDYYSMSEHTDHEESSPMQQQNSSQNTGGGSPRRKSPSPEDGGSPIKFPRRESNNSSSEEAGGSPRSNFSDSESELCMGFRGANLGRK